MGENEEKKRARKTKKPGGERRKKGKPLPKRIPDEKERKKKR